MLVCESVVGSVAGLVVAGVEKFGFDEIGSGADFLLLCAHAANVMIANTLSANFAERISFSLIEVA